MKSLHEIMLLIGEEAPYLVYKGYGKNKANTDYDSETAPTFGTCRCMHSYDRHFDWMEDDDAYTQCKYCSCGLFTSLLGSVHPSRIEENGAGYQEWRSFVVDVDLFFKRPAEVILNDPHLIRIQHILQLRKQEYAKWCVIYANKDHIPTLEEYLGLSELLWPIDLSDHRIARIHTFYQYDPSTYKPYDSYTDDTEWGW